MAPHARIVVYKALYRLFGGYVAAVVAAIEQVYEELVQAIKDAEQWLLQLKRARLLREVDSVLDSSKYVTDDVKVEPLDPTQVEAEPLADLSYSVGSKCRIRHTDGRWYDGLIFGLEGYNSAKIYFLTLTSENILIDYVAMDTVMLLGQIDDVCMGAIYIIFFLYGKHVQLICFVITFLFFFFFFVV